MIRICARPTGEPVVKGEGVYVCEFKVADGDYRPVMKVRAKTGAQAEEKLMFVFEHELDGKVLDFRIEDFKTNGTMAGGLHAGSPDANE